MSTGYIRVKAFIANLAAPVPGARVVITQSVDGAAQQIATVTTDREGLTPLVEVETPPVQLSRDFQNTQLPYAEYTVGISADGYYPITIQDIQVFEGQTALQHIEMLPQVRGRLGPTQETKVIIPPHTLFEAGPKSGQFVEGPTKPTRTLKGVVIPETIVVHLGTPSSSARNVYVPFKDYVKNVASSEVYPTWDEHAIKANIYAILSFTLNRVYTEWYRSRDHEFQITNTTAYDQAYVHGRNIYTNISQIVDEIFNQYLRRPNFTSPLFASYCDGRQTNCEGLKQWGTQELATQGYNYNQILDYYYGLLEISMAKEVEGIPRSYPGEPLRLGDYNENVRRIQGWLTRISENYPAIGNVPPTGRFDERTQEAVRTFQRVFQLVQDGIVGRATWYKIVQIYVSVTRLAELDTEAINSENAVSAYPGYIISEGQRGANVKTVQSILALLSTFYEEIAPIDVDGIFGADTTEAVRQFQQIMGLTVDGLVGKATWNALQEEYAAIQADIEGVQDPYPGVLLRVGSGGDSVRKIQTYLNAIAGNYPQIPVVAADGIFGQRTEQQVRAYQGQFGLPADGIVGVNTWDSIVTTYSSLNTPEEDAVETFGPQQAHIRKELMGPSYPPVGFDPPFTIPRGTDNVTQCPPTTRPPSDESDSEALPSAPQQPTTPEESSTLPPIGSRGQNSRGVRGSGNTANQWGRGLPPRGMSQEELFRREQQLAFRTIYGLVQQGLLDRHTWEVLTPLRNMIEGRPPYGPDGSESSQPRITGDQSNRTQSNIREDN